MTRKKFEEIYRKHYPEMYRLARTILYDEDESKDAVSEVFTKLLRADIEPQEDKLQWYLMTSVRNKCRDVLRHKSVRQRVENLYAADLKQEQAATTCDDETLDRINEFVKHELSPLSQQILQLRFLGEMKYEEVAEAAGVSRVTVHRHLSDALQRIREFINEPTKR